MIRRIQCIEFIFRDSGKPGGQLNVNLLSDRDLFEVRSIRNGFELNTVAARMGNDISDGNQLGNIVSGFSWKINVLVIDRFISTVVFVDGFFSDPCPQLYAASASFQLPNIL